MSISFFILFIATLVTSIGMSHGEDKLGPNGGYIRMPGSFHTEVVKKGKSKLEVYLLDMEWKNPTTINSQVDVIIKQSGASESLKCISKDVYFECTLPKKVNLKAGTLEIQATRSDKKGNIAIYDLPLTLTKKETDHSNHH